MIGSCTRISQQGLGQFSPLIKKPAAAGFHRDHAEEVGSYLASSGAFSALRRQVMRKKSSHSSGPSVHNVHCGAPCARLDEARILSLTDRVCYPPIPSCEISQLCLLIRGSLPRAGVEADLNAPLS